MNKSITKNKTNIAIGVIILLIGAVTAQNILLSDLGYETAMRSFYNNYLIFKNAYFHLLFHQNLYILSNDVQVDLFKYSPTFALLFGFFAILPDFLGLFLWNLLNAIVFYSIWKVSFPLVKNKIWVIAFILLEFITNTQNSQSNGLMAGLIILGYVFLEKKNIAIATLMIVLSVYVKLFGVVAFVLFLFYPDKWKAIGYSVLWFALLFALPLLVMSPSELVLQYQNWGAMLLQDEAVSYSPSVMGWLKSWFSVEPSLLILTSIGIMLFLVPLIQFKKYKAPIFKQLILASVLIWVVIFNHKAESPTFIIAISGVAIWFYSQPRNILNTILVILALVFTQLSPTDLFPSSVKSALFIPYVIKVVPVILIWIKLLYDSFQLKSIPN